MKIIIKLLLALLLFGCLLKMPYGYYQFVRLAAFAGFIAIAYVEYKENRIITVVLSVLCAILFNPIVKIYLKKDTWQLIDESIAIGLTAWIVIDLIIYLLNKRTVA